MDRLISEASESRFGTYVEALVGAIGHADRAAPLRDYCLGLLMPGQAALAHRRCRHFATPLAKCLALRLHAGGGP